MEIEILFSEAVSKSLTEILKPVSFDWTPIIATLGGAFIGSAASIIPQKYILSARQKNEADSLRIALSSEISSIYNLIEKRNYSNEIEKNINFLEKENSPDFQIKFEIKVSDNYNIVYKANAGKIGLLPKQFSENTVRFHHILDAIICDIGENGFIATKGGNIEDFKMIRYLLEELKNIAKELR